jgi:mono/diheme cytochrome c family protein
MFAGLFFLATLEGLSIGFPPPVNGQADSSAERNLASSPQSKERAARQLFQQHCTKCHVKDGSGNLGRPSFPDIPDFTAPSWQAQRSDKELLTSILEGKGDDMPAFAKKIKREQARDLVDYVRSFAPGKERTKKEKQEKPDSPGLDERFRRLQKEMDELFRQYRALSELPDPQARNESRPSSK